MAKAVKFEWDPAKRNANIAKHDVDFTEAYRLDWDQALTVDQKHGDEIRHLTYAPIGDRLYACVWTDRDSQKRIVSLRKANRREVRRYG